MYDVWWAGIGGSIADTSMTSLDAGYMAGALHDNPTIRHLILSTYPLPVQVCLPYSGVVARTLWRCTAVVSR